jgi:hypothetical protein
MPRVYRPEVLPKFYGKMGEEVDTWLCQVEEILGMNPIQNEDLRIRYVGMALRETAASWYASMRRADADERITDWASFIQKLRAQFITVDPSWLARDGSLRMLRLREALLQAVLSLSWYSWILEMGHQLRCRRWQQKRWAASLPTPRMQSPSLLLVPFFYRCSFWGLALRSWCRWLQ